MELDLDTYNLKARLAPFLLVVLPIAFAVVVWLPVESDVWKTIGSLGASASLTFLMVQLGRDSGKTKQTKLFRAWDGKPTTRMLRHRDSTLDTHSKERYHKVLGLLMPDTRLPSFRAEKGNPEAADAVYDSCTRHLIEATRDKKKHPLIFEANVTYGFRRNYWAMKPAGIASATSGLFSGAINAVYCLLESKPIASTSICAIAISGLLLTWWLLRITPHWVKLAGDAYAERLLAACETLKR